jgi:hypothetical protein
VFFFFLISGVFLFCIVIDYCVIGFRARKAFHSKLERSSRTSLSHSSYQLPSTIYPATSYQLPATSYQLPATSYHLSRYHLEAEITEVHQSCDERVKNSFYLQAITVKQPSLALVTVTTRLPPGTLPYTLETVTTGYHPVLYPAP